MLIIHPISLFRLILSILQSSLLSEKKKLRNTEGEEKNIEAKILLPIFLLNIPQEKGEAEEGARKNCSQAVTEILAIDTRRISIVTISTSRGQQVRSQATAANMVAITIS